jgi:antitoxin PrlF
MTSTTTLTSKGQMTLPKTVRERLGLRSGDRLDVAIEGKRIVLVPKTLHIDDICSILPAPSVPVSVERMNEAIEQGATNS